VSPLAQLIDGGLGSGLDTTERIQRNAAVAIAREKLYCRGCIRPYWSFMMDFYLEAVRCCGPILELRPDAVRFRAVRTA
jgi:hypothetical protein